MDLNSHSVGIEFVNPGFLKAHERGRWVDYHGGQWNEAQLTKHGGFVLAEHPIVGEDTYAWPNFPEAQLETGRKVLAALLDAYPIEDALSHEEIDTRGWKTDPGPAFPLEDFRAQIRSAIPTG